VCDWKRLHEVLNYSVFTPLQIHLKLGALKALYGRGPCLPRLNAAFRTLNLIQPVRDVAGKRDALAKLLK
jgi:hypothetical protein